MRARPQVLDKPTVNRLVREARGKGSKSATAFEQLLVAHHWLIESLAKKLTRHYPQIDFDDALQASRIGFWHAVQDYNPERGALLSSHAMFRIRSQQNRLKFSLRHAPNEMHVPDVQAITDEITRRVSYGEGLGPGWRGKRAEMSPLARKRYQIILSILNRLGPARTAALREKFNLHLPGPDLKMSDYSTRSERYYSDALKTLRVAARELFQEEMREKHEKPGKLH